MGFHTFMTENNGFLFYHPDLKNVSFACCYPLCTEVRRWFDESIYSVRWVNRPDRIYFGFDRIYFGFKFRRSDFS